MDSAAAAALSRSVLPVLIEWTFVLGDRTVREMRVTDDVFDGKAEGREDRTAEHCNAVFADVQLIAAQVGGDLNLNGTKVTGKLDMNGLQTEL